MNRLACFKSYDVRGRIGHDLDAGTFDRIGRAFATTMSAKLVVTGRDARATSKEFQQALNEGLAACGVDVIDIGLCGTEEVYFATEHFGADGGLMVTASHNPIDYNGLKIVGSGARPISWDQGLGEIHDLTRDGGVEETAAPGTIRHEDPRAAYVERVLSFIDAERLPEGKVVVNAGNGAAGPTFDAIAQALEERGARTRFVRVHHEPDSAFPNGIPNPLLEENRPATADPVRAEGAIMGAAWDGDFDRCFFFDETGEFVDGEYVVGLLAEAFLAKSPGAKIVHDPRVIWNTQALVADAGGDAVVSKTGHALVKAKMREADAVYGGEMSAHHYFREFMYCDSGMIPLVLVLEHMGKTGLPLSEMVAGYRAAFPSSGEINFHIEDPAAAMERVEAHFSSADPEVDRLDGLSLSFGDWRLNLRKSSTEPVVRLNLECRGDADLLAAKLAEVRSIVQA